MNTRTLLALGLSASLLAVGCEDKKDPAKSVTGAAGAAADKVKEAGAKGTEAVKDAAAKGTDAVKDAAAKGTEAAKDAAGKTTEAVKDAAAKGTDAVKDAAGNAMAKIKEEGSKWISDTVEKQWPAAKAAVADLGKKAADLKDPALKTKIMDAVKSLTGQETDVEGLVSKLKDAKDSDYSTVLASLKEKFAGFMKKLDEVKAMMPK